MHVMIFIVSGMGNFIRCENVFEVLETSRNLLKLSWKIINVYLINIFGSGMDNFIECCMIYIVYVKGNLWVIKKISWKYNILTI